MRASTTFWSFVSLVGFGIQQVDAYATLSWKDVRGGEAWCPTGKSMNGNDFNTVMSALPNQPNPLIWPTPSNAPEFGSSMFYYCNTVAFQIGTGSDDINETEPFFANLKSLSVSFPVFVNRKKNVLMSRF